MLPALESHDKVVRPCIIYRHWKIDADYRDIKIIPRSISRKAAEPDDSESTHLHVAQQVLRSVPVNLLLFVSQNAVRNKLWMNSPT